MRTRLGGGGFSRYVCLGGGGAPEKDRILLASMARARACQKRPRLVLIDHHAAMLDVSRESLPRSAARIAEVEFACRDFMDLRCDAQLSRAKGATMWLLSGATFGNIDEEMFSEAVGTVASAGDWLVLGVDLRDNRDPSGQRHRLIAAYGSPEGRRLFALAAGRNPEKDSDAIRVDVVEAYKDCLSSVPGSLSLIAGWDGCRPIRSNRYDRNFLRHWWQLRGWREIAAVAGPAGGTYRQVILERI